jgi:hypothetical protein
MKKKLMCACGMMVFLVAVTKVNGQIQQGNLLVGADIANVDLSLDKGGNFAFRIDPKLAWFVRDNVALGAYFLVGLSTAKNAGTSVNYGLGALGRYYINDKTVNLVQHSRFFFEGTVGIEGDNPAVGDNTNGLGLGVGPGWTYFITPNIGLEALLKYNGIVGFGSAPTSNNLNLSVGFQIYLPSSRAKAIRNDVERERK